MDMESLFALVFVLVIVAGVLVILMAMRQRSQFLEMQHRERMAMIERGLTPESHPIQRLIRASVARGAGSSRSMTLGIVVVAVGLGLMSIVSIAAGSPDVGVGIGGAIVIVGASFIINSLIGRTMGLAPPPASSSPPPPPIDRVE